MLCFDEKSQIQSLLPMAQDVAQGELLTKCRQRQRHHEFLGFLRQIERRVPNGLYVHLIVDNSPPPITYASLLNPVERCFG